MTRACIEIFGALKIGDEGNSASLVKLKAVSRALHRDRLRGYPGIWVLLQDKRDGPGSLGPWSQTKLLFGPPSHLSFAYVKMDCDQMSGRPDSQHLLTSISA